MGTVAINTVIQHWGYIAPLLAAPRNDAEYDALVEALDAVLDAGGANEDNPLAVLADRMGDLVAGYEANHSPEIVGSGVDALRFLMDSHGLSQGALPEIASQGVMSEILAGKRELNLRQVRALCARFGVPAQVFISEAVLPIHQSHDALSLQGGENIGDLVAEWKAEGRR